MIHSGRRKVLPRETPHSVAAQRSRDGAGTSCGTHLALGGLSVGV